MSRIYSEGGNLLLEAGNLLRQAIQYKQAAFIHPVHRCPPPSYILFGCLKNLVAAAPQNEQN
jgi:hypothetical protein